MSLVTKIVKGCSKGRFAAIKPCTAFNPMCFSVAVRGLLILDFKSLDDTVFSFSKSRYGLEEKLLILFTCLVAASLVLIHLL